ncbi:IS30 family transposase [Ralstonia pseudosolanacearum]|nr:IS30 family transposase [Ralstonia solanacearum]
MRASARGLKQAMIDALRQEKPVRGRRRTTLAGGGFVPEALRIVHRPEAIELRQLPGHWEGDLIKGAFNRSCVGTLVERKTRFVVLCRMDGCTARDALEGFTRQMKKLPAFLRESLTYDRGTEMTCHVELSKRLNLDIWFADPHAPWQRGSNENTNGLLRQFLPKGIDLSAATQTQLNDIAKLLNGRPRQTLGWDTPEEAMAKELEIAGLAKRCT